MGYQITTHEPIAELRDDQHSATNMRRTLATRRIKSDAIETARALLKTHAEVTIWKGEPGDGEIIENWLPQKTIILSEPRWLGTAGSVKPWPTRGSTRSAQSLQPMGIALDNPLSPDTLMRIANGAEKFFGLPFPALVDRHFYEYTGGDGRKVNFAFECHYGEAPEVPKFGTQAAIERYQRQWEYCNYQKRKSVEVSTVATRPCS